MKDRGSNLEEVLKSMLNVISNDRIIHKEGPTMSALEAANARENGRANSAKTRTHHVRFH